MCSVGCRALALGPFPRNTPLSPLSLTLLVSLTTPSSFFHSPALTQLPEQYDALSPSLLLPRPKEKEGERAGKASGPCCGHQCSRSSSTGMQKARPGITKHYLHHRLSKVLGTPVTKPRLHRGRNEAFVSHGIVGIVSGLSGREQRITPRPSPSHGQKAHPPVPSALPTPRWAKESSNALPRV